MSLQEFLERFAPYQHCLNITVNQDVITIFGQGGIDPNYQFSEALQRFTDVICERQRENCANDAVLDWNDFDDENPNFEDIDVDDGSIYWAEQPKIEEL
jgi:hypothetical protein